jgi:hypothetical protein
MAAYVLLTVFLFQKGSAEFKSLMWAAAVNLTWQPLGQRNSAFDASVGQNGHAKHEA